MHIGLFNGLLLIPFGSIYQRFDMFLLVILGLHNGSLFNIQNYPNDETEIIFWHLHYWGYNIIGIWAMFSCFVENM